METTQPPSSKFRPVRQSEWLDDGVRDPCQEHGKLAEPAVCGSCGAMYHEGRWQWMMPTANALQTRCAACRRIEENLPAGYVTVEGPFAQSHHDEIVALVRKLEQHEKARHPLKRIMSIAEDHDSLLITTTDIQLASEIGQALQDAYEGELSYHYNEQEFLLRVRWWH